MKAPWDAWTTIRAANPLIMHNPHLRKSILRERDEARRNPTLQNGFESYRLNRPGADASSMLLTLQDWRKVCARPCPAREGGAPVLGLDVGGERSWCAAWAMWPNGRCEAYAAIGGIPALADRERQDGVPRGAYEALAAAGTLVVDEGHRIARPAVLIDLLAEHGIEPEYAICDRFLHASLEDAIGGRFTLNVRRTRWSESTEDIAAFRQMAIDGPPFLSVAPESVKLASLSLAAATVLTDEQGSSRLVKTRAHRSRDDVVIAGTLAAGALRRGHARAGQFLDRCGMSTAKQRREIYVTPRWRQVRELVLKPFRVSLHGVSGERAHNRSGRSASRQARLGAS